MSTSATTTYNVIPMAPGEIEMVSDPTGAAGAETQPTAKGKIIPMDSNRSLFYTWGNDSEEWKKNLLSVKTGNKLVLFDVSELADIHLLNFKTDYAADNSDFLCIGSVKTETVAGSHVFILEDADGEGCSMGLCGNVSWWKSFGLGRKLAFFNSIDEFSCEAIFSLVDCPDRKSLAGTVREKAAGGNMPAPEGMLTAKCRIKQDEEFMLLQVVCPDDDAVMIDINRYGYEEVVVSHSTQIPDRQAFAFGLVQESLVTKRVGRIASAKFLWRALFVSLLASIGLGKIVLATGVLGCPEGCFSGEYEMWDPVYGTMNNTCWFKDEKAVNEFFATGVSQSCLSPNGFPYCDPTGSGCERKYLNSPQYLDPTSSAYKLPWNKNGVLPRPDAPHDHYGWDPEEGFTWFTCDDADEPCTSPNGFPLCSTVPTCEFLWYKSEWYLNLDEAREFEVHGLHWHY